MAFARTIMTVAAIVAPTVARAHTGFHGEGVAAGFGHPFAGLDHLLAMVAVGFWAARLGGRARWLVPATFVLLMAAGAIMGLNGLAFPGLDAALAATVVVLGLAVAFEFAPPVRLATALVGSFALLHGLAHGAETPAAAATAYGAGFIAATVVLHASGMAMGALATRRPLVRLAGLGAAGAGLALAIL